MKEELLRITKPPYYKQGEFYVIKRKTKQGCQLCGKIMDKGALVWRFSYSSADYTTKKFQRRTIYMHAKHFTFHKPSQCPDRYKKIATTERSYCLLCET